MWMYCTITYLEACITHMYLRLLYAADRAHVTVGEPESHGSLLSPFFSNQMPMAINQRSKRRLSFFRNCCKIVKNVSYQVTSLRKQELSLWSQLEKQDSSKKNPTCFLMVQFYRKRPGLQEFQGKLNPTILHPGPSQMHCHITRQPCPPWSISLQTGHQ